LENGSETALKRRKVPDYLKKFDKIADKKTLLRTLSIDDLQLYHAYQEELRNDTEHELTDTEYEIFAMMRLYLHKYYTWSQDKKPDEIDVVLQQMTARYEKALAFAMKSYREKGARKDWDLRSLKEGLINMRAEDGGEFTFEFKKPRKEKIIDVIVDDND